MCVCVCSLSYTICITNYFFVVLHCSLWPDWVFHLFCILSHKNQKFGEYILYTKCVFWIPIQMLSQTLFILITIQSDITITAPTVHFHVHCSLSSHNLVAPEFSTQFRKLSLYIYIYIYNKFYENSSGCRPVLPYGQKDEMSHLTKLIVDLRIHSNCWFILSVSCNTVSCDTDMTHSQFYPQHPTAVSSQHSSKSHKPTSWPHCVL